MAGSWVGTPPALRHQRAGGGPGTSLERATSVPRRGVRLQGRKAAPCIRRRMPHNAPVPFGGTAVSEPPVAPPALSAGQRWLVLVAAFLAWAFAGLGISLYILIHRQLVLGLLPPGVDEAVVTRWFAWFQAAFLFGAAAGGWLFGWLGDRVGRARALGAAVLCYSLFSLAAYFAVSLEQHLALRWLASLGIGGTWPGAVALVSEAWPEASRPLLAGLLGAAANVGFVLLGALAYCYPVTGEAWRWPLLIAATPAVLGLAVLIGLPESPRWR